MLDSLKIQNFKNIKDLEIPVLAEVNLITGKNNTGKTSILEALSIWASDMDFRWIFDLLKERGEVFFIEKSERRNIDVLKSFMSLFFQKNFVYEDTELTIFIGSGNENIQFSMENPYTIASYYGDNYEEFLAKIKKRVSKQADSLTVKKIQEHYRFHSKYQLQNFQFVWSFTKESEKNFSLWSKITLSPKEDYVIEALKIVEPKLEKIAFVEGEYSRDERKVIAKIKNSNETINLKSMGDGMNRILTVILHLVNSENGYCFIDEFDNGLHYSVQEKLWEIVFFLSQKLNIQVFATTHSRDCVEGFAEVCNMENYQNKGKLIHLANVEGEIRAVEYDSHELKIANHQNIDLR